jgi:hypothetical protein
MCEKKSKCSRSLYDLFILQRKDAWDLSSGFAACSVGRLRRCEKIRGPERIYRPFPAPTVPALREGFEGVKKLANPIDPATLSPAAMPPAVREGSCLLGWDLSTSCGSAAVLWPTWFPLTISTASSVPDVEHESRAALPPKALTSQGCGSPCASRATSLEFIVNLKEPARHLQSNRSGRNAAWVPWAGAGTEVRPYMENP